MKSWEISRNLWKDPSQPYFLVTTEHNMVIFGEELIEPAGEDDGAFVDADFQSELLFDTTLEPSEKLAHHDDQAEFHAERVPEVPMEICAEEISDKRRRVTKPRPDDDTAQTHCKRRRKTLLQKIKRRDK